jgi:hypothetical protein
MAPSWKNRIVGEGVQPASQFLAHPQNWRVHPQGQREAMRGILNEIGWVQRVIVNATTGYLLDGHERVWQALQNGDEDVPYLEVELSEQEERYMLATLDPVAAMAQTDEAALRDLLQGVQTSEVGVAELLGELLPEEEGNGRGVETSATDEVLLEQAVQLRPAREYVVVMCQSDMEWARLQEALGLRMSRRGGYKVGSPFDAKGVNRVVYAADLLDMLGGADADSDT